MEECWYLLYLIVKVKLIKFQSWLKEAIEANSMAKPNSIASDLRNHCNPYPSGMIRLWREMDNAVR